MNERQGPGGVRALFRNRNFVALFLARETGWLSTAITDAAIGWQIFSIRHSALDLGLIGLVLFIPQLLLALPAGVIGDRFERRTVCVLSGFANAALTAVLFVLTLAHSTSLPLYFGVLALTGIAYTLGVPAQRSMLPTIVTPREFVRASATISSVSQFIAIAGPAVAGLLIVIGTPVAFAVAVVAQLVSTASFFLLERRPPADANEHAAPVLHAALEGVRYVFSRKIVLGAISLDLFAVLFGGAVSMLPAYATQVLHVGPTGFGILRAAPGIGAALVAMFIVRRPIERHAGRWLLWCVTGFGVFTIVFGASRNFALSVVALALTGGFDMVSMVIRTTLVQLQTPDEMRGRVGAVENIFIGASNELGAFESGSAAALLGLVPSVILGGIATCAVIALWSVLFPQLRTFDHLHDHASS
ncbi:MAG: MFS transporter [bacterium]|nr:MFS transporter [bacterium]